MPSPFGGQSQQRWGDNTLTAHEFMRDMQLTDLTGKVCNTADARKKGWIALLFFDVTHPDCREVLPLVQKLADAYKESGKLTVWGVSQSDATATRAYLTDHPMTFPVLVDYDKYHALLYGVTSLPTLFVADGGGLVQSRIAGVRANGLNDVSRKFAAFADVDGQILMDGGPIARAIGDANTSRAQKAAALAEAAQAEAALPAPSAA